MSAAGAAGRDGHTGFIEGCEELKHLALLACKTQAEMAGQPLDRVADQVSMRHGCSEPREEMFPQLNKVAGFRFHFFARQSSGRSEADDPRYVFGGGTQAALLSSAEHDRLQLNAVARIKRADPFWTVQFMRGQ